MKIFVATVFLLLLIAGIPLAQTYQDDDFIQAIVVSSADSFNAIFFPWPDSIPGDSMITVFAPADHDTIFLSSVGNMDLYDIEGIYQGTTSNFVPYEIYFQAFRYVPEISQYYYGSVTSRLRFEVTIQPIEEVTIDSVLVD